MKITSLIVRDIRFPTSLQQDGSDALNQGDYSAAYVVLVRYMPPQRAGYNIDIKPASIAEFESPSGRFWGARR